MRDINQILQEMGIKEIPKIVRLKNIDAATLFLHELSERRIHEDLKMSLVKLYYDTLNAVNGEDTVGLKDAAIILNTTIEFIFSDIYLASALTKLLIYDFRDCNINHLKNKYKEELKIITEKGEIKNYEN